MLTWQWTLVVVVLLVLVRLVAVLQSVCGYDRLLVLLVLAGPRVAGHPASFRASVDGNAGAGRVCGGDDSSRHRRMAAGARRFPVDYTSIRLIALAGLTPAVVSRSADWLLPAGGGSSSCGL